MPIDLALIAARLGKPCDFRHLVTDRDERHPTASAATQANTRDLAKRHIDHAAHSQLILVLTVFRHGRESPRRSPSVEVPSLQDRQNRDHSGRYLPREPTEWNREKP